MKKKLILILLFASLLYLKSTAQSNVHYNIDGDFSCGNTVEVCFAIECNFSIFNVNMDVNPTCSGVTLNHINTNGCISITLDNNIPKECCENGYIEFSVTPSWNPNSYFYFPLECYQSYLVKIPYKCCSVNTQCPDECYWKLGGNDQSITSTNNVLGTLSDFDVKFVTNSIERGILTKAGNFGLGTMNPTAQLHTNGNVRLEGLGNNDTLNRIIVQDFSGNLSFRNANTLSGGGTNIFNSDGLLTGARTMTMSGNTLNFTEGNGVSITTMPTFNTSNPLLSLIHNSSPTNNFSGRMGLNINVSTPGLLSTANMGMNIDCYGSEHENNGLRILTGTVNEYFNRGALIITQGGTLNNTGLDVRSNAPFSSTGTSVGILASASGGTNPFSGVFNGTSAQVGGVFQISDQNVKVQIKDINGALAILDKINPKVYQFDNSKYPTLNLSKNVDSYGVLAQEMEQVLPQLVKSVPIPRELDDKNSYSFSEETVKAVNYTELIPITIAAVKELEAKIEIQNNAILENAALKMELTSVKEQLAVYDEKFELLEKVIAQLCENGCEGLNKFNQSLENNTEVPVLFQSIPNPTYDEALIYYNLVSDKSNAEINVYSEEGKVFISKQLESKVGKGKVKLSVVNLPSGIYFYSLVIDGIVIDTKKMQILK